MKTIDRIALALLAALLAFGATAQEPVLREGQVTERALVDALSPPAAAASPRTKVARRSSSPSSPTRPS